MRLLLTAAICVLTPFLANASTEISTICLGKAGDQVSPSTTGESILGNIPEDLRELAFQVGSKELATVPLSWSVAGMRMLRLMGVQEAELRQQVRAQLSKFLEPARSMGLTNGADRLRSLSGPSADRSLPVSGGSPMARLNLDPYTKLYNEIGGIAEDRFDDATQLKDAYVLAAEVGEVQLAKEILFLMIRSNQFDDAAEVARQAGNEEAMITVAMFALVEFFREDVGRLNPNYRLDYAIKILSKVQGAKQPEASAKLKALGDVLNDSWFVGMTAVRTLKTPNTIFQVFSLRMLSAWRFSGKLIRKERLFEEDSPTLVTDPEVRANILTAVEKLLAQGENPYRLFHALQAIEAYDLMSKVADGLMAEGRYGVAHKFYLEAGRRKDAQTAILKEIELATFPSALLAIDELARRGDTETLKLMLDALKLRAASDSKGAEHSAIEGIENVLKGKNRDAGRYDEFRDTLPNGREMPEWLVRQLSQENWIRTQIQKSYQRTLEVRRALVRDGYGYLRGGNPWNAYNVFLDARHRPGLIEAARTLMRTDSINAPAPLEAAIMIPRDVRDEALMMEGCQCLER